MSEVQKFQAWSPEDVQRLILAVRASDFDAEHALRLAAEKRGEYWKGAHELSATRLMEAERQVGELREENSAIRQLHCLAFDEMLATAAKLDMAMGLLQKSKIIIDLMGDESLVGELHALLNTTSTEGKDHE